LQQNYSQSQNSLLLDFNKIYSDISPIIHKKLQINPTEPVYSYLLNGQKIVE